MRTRSTSLGMQQQFFLAGAGAVDVDGGPDALVDEAAVEVQLHVAGALELLEDHFVHAAAGVDQGGGQDRQAAAFLELAGGAEEALRLLHGVGVETAGEELAAGRGLGVVGPGQAGDRIEQDDDVLAVLDHALGLFQDDVADVDVLAGRLVEGAGDDLAVGAGHGAGHVGHFLGPLVDEQHDEVAFGMVLDQAQGDLLQQDRLAGPRRRDDQAALALADRRDQVDDAHGQFVGGGFQEQPAVGVQRRQVFEGGRRDAFLAGRLPLTRSTCIRAKLSCPSTGRRIGPSTTRPVRRPRRRIWLGRDVDVFRRGQVVVGQAAQEAVAVGQDFERAGAADDQPRSICRRTTAMMSWPRFMPVCSAMPSFSAKANSLGIGRR